MESAHFEALYPSQSRFDVIEQLFTYIKSGNSCQLLGAPGVGRANTLELLAYNRTIREAHVGENQKWFHFVTVNFSEVRNKPLFQATKLMFLELVDSLKERGLLEEYRATSDIFREALSFQDELVLFQGLKKTIEYLAIEKELTIIFLLERFEEYIPMLNQDFFSNLRILRNLAKYRFSVVFSLGRPLEEIIEPTMLADFYEFVVGNQVYLPLWDEAVARFRLSYLEKVTEGKISEKIYQQIIALTGGHGKLTRLTTEIYLATKETPSAAFFLSKKSIQGALLELLYYLTPEEQLYLKQQDAQNLFLEKIGLLVHGKPTIPLLESFLKGQDLPHEKLEYDVATNTIRRGPVIISDMLTKSEFRLLALLIEHVDKVIDRETIIQTVWNDLQATSGVTDQAIDQLVLRLRKKIEIDPNNPQHIQTIKGRGLIFHS